MGTEGRNAPRQRPAAPASLPPSPARRPSRVPSRAQFWRASVRARARGGLAGCRGRVRRASRRARPRERARRGRSLCAPDARSSAPRASPSEPCKTRIGEEGNSFAGSARRSVCRAPFLPFRITIEFVISRVSAFNFLSPRLALPPSLSLLLHTPRFPLALERPSLSVMPTEFTTVRRCLPPSSRIPRDDARCRVPTDKRHTRTHASKTRPRTASGGSQKLTPPRRSTSRAIPRLCVRSRVPTRSLLFRLADGMARGGHTVSPLVGRQPRLVRQTRRQAVSFLLSSPSLSIVLTARHG